MYSPLSLALTLFFKYMIFLEIICFDLNCHIVLGLSQN